MSGSAASSGWLSQGRRAAGRLLDHSVRPLLPGALARGRQWPGGEVPRCGQRGGGGNRGALDRGGVRAWRAQHRQHQHHRRELRLRAVAVPAALRSGLHRGLFRPDRALCVRAAARHAGVEPDAAGRGAAAALRARPAGGGAQPLLAGLPAQRSGRRCWIGWGSNRWARTRMRNCWCRRCSTSSTRRRCATSSSSSTGAAAMGARAMRSPAAEHYRGACVRDASGMLTARTPMAAAPPISTIHISQRETPRTMLIEEMEALWAPIAERDDWSGVPRGARRDRRDAPGLCGRVAPGVSVELRRPRGQASQSPTRRPFAERAPAVFRRIA